MSDPNRILFILIIHAEQNEVLGYVAERDVFSLSLYPGLSHSMRSSADCTPKSRNCDAAVFWPTMGSRSSVVRAFYVRLVADSVRLTSRPLELKPNLIHGWMIR